MRASEACSNLIKRFEGFRADVYLCPSGVPSVGYGHTEGVKMGMRSITEEEANLFLATDLMRYEKGVTDAATVPLTQSEFDALVSLTFNIGIGNLRTSSLIRHLNAGDRAAAGAEFSKWDKGRQGGKLVVLQGLANRRASERLLFEGRTINVY